MPRCKKNDCTDIVKPNIVFFGESLPKRFDLHTRDLNRTDLVIIMGTSLEVWICTVKKCVKIEAYFRK